MWPFYIYFDSSPRTMRLQRPLPYCITSTLGARLFTNSSPLAPAPLSRKGLWEYKSLTAAACRPPALQAGGNHSRADFNSYQPLYCEEFENHPSVSTLQTYAVTPIWTCYFAGAPQTMDSSSGDFGSANAANEARGKKAGYFTIKRISKCRFACDKQRANYSGTNFSNFLFTVARI